MSKTLAADLLTPYDGCLNRLGEARMMTVAEALIRAEAAHVAKVRMTPDQFAEVSRIMRRPGPARDAARLVLVDGMRVTDAVRATGVSQPSVSAAVKRAKSALEKLQAVEWG